MLDPYRVIPKNLAVSRQHCRTRYHDMMTPEEGCYVHRPKLTVTRREFTCQNCGGHVFAESGALTQVRLCRSCLEKARVEHRQPAAEIQVPGAASPPVSGIDSMLFDRVKSTRYDPTVGFYASWAIWANTPEDDLRLLNDPLSLKELRSEVVMVALNPSARIPVPLRNFHGGSGGSGRLRHVFKLGTPGSPFRGAYMTDFITTRVEVNSQNLNLTPAEIRENARRFVQELNDLGSERPLILAFGKQAYQLVLENIPSNKRGPAICLPHYSYRGLNRNGDYCQAVWSLLPKGWA